MEKLLFYLDVTTSFTKQCFATGILFTGAQLLCDGNCFCLFCYLCRYWRMGQLSVMRGAPAPVCTKIKGIVYASLCL